MKHTIPYGDWHIALLDAIEKANDGDIIEVHNETMMELAESAKANLCPRKKIKLVLEVTNE